MYWTMGSGGLDDHDSTIMVSRYMDKHLGSSAKA